jgi:hypothetical protein
MCGSGKRTCRHDVARESIHRMIERMPAGVPFTLMDVFKRDRFGPTCVGTFSMLYVTVQEAVAAGLLERAGRYPSQGSPVLYQKPPTRHVENESMQPPPGWRRSSVQS